MKKRAAALYSGGLDSLLSIAMMQRLGYPVTPIFFRTPFFGPDKALRAARSAGFEVRVIDITEPHLEMLKSPVYGFGRNLNPCIDCHGLMFRMAAQLIEDGEVDFLISGEVLGQRPKSQRHDAMNAVRKLSGVKDLIVRPLCQKLLPDTLPIREGWVDKEDMLDIQGRTRRRQMELAEQWGIADYNTPGGGCLLTDAAYSVLLRDLLEHGELVECNLRFLRYGRHYRLGPTTRLIVGKTSYDNEGISGAAKQETVLKVMGIHGPLGVIQGEASSEQLQLAADIVFSHTQRAGDEDLVCYGLNFQLVNRIRGTRMTPEQLEVLRIR
jgi:tRNA-uridine 2-sulfurtransferase